MSGPRFTRPRHRRLRWLQRAGFQLVPLDIALACSAVGFFAMAVLAVVTGYYP